MESDISQAFQKELTCFICLSCLTDPVTISCGHSFCRACLHLSWEDIQPPVRCPLCREQYGKELRTNIVLKKLVSIVRQASLMKDLSSEEQKCVTHEDTKKIFCAENRIFLCPLCSNSHEHREHRNCPIEEAAADQMDRLLKQMASLWEKVQENQENLESGNRMRTLWTGLDDMFRRGHRHCPIEAAADDQMVSDASERTCKLERGQTFEANGIFMGEGPRKSREFRGRKQNENPLDSEYENHA
ncbi:tripartite motif-containing protein 43-like [Peromyscus eremicus]|uniref:tripartite motif-containing protein 43-like n=1 Tax=Peromyscus eremicus TaxID=42410 RepID=UPI0027DBB14F|nr:tripartite motif-containing protein 43-like [Peromyscus eremicus]